MDPEQQRLAKAIDLITCPECGQLGSPAVATFEGGLTAIIPRFQCDTDGCEYHRDGPTAWTLAFTS
jgi:hypothetical protein